MSERARTRRFAPRVAVTRDRGREAAAERVAHGGPAAGRVIETPAPAVLGLGPGRRLPSAERGYFERRLGADLGAVRVHPDATVAADLGAHGVAAGRDIAVAPGQWRPGTAAFRRLLGHELAHLQQQGRSGPAVQLDDPDPLFKEAKSEEAVTAVSGGLKTVADEAGKNEELKTYGLGLAERYALPVWGGMTDAEKVGVVGFGVGTYGLGLGAMTSGQQGRATLSDVNLALPLKLVPYATVDSFSFTLPKTRTDPLALRFSLKGDDLLELAHDQGYVPKMTLSFDFTLTVAPDGSVAMPYALANFGLLPGVNVAGGWGLTTDWRTMVQPQAGAPLAPYEAFPKAAQPAPPTGAGVYFSIDLLKAPFIPAKYRALFGGAPADMKDTGK